MLKTRNSRGQSLAEFVTLFIVIAVCVYLMKSYLVHSARAQLLLWQDSANNAMAEDISDVHAPGSFPPPSYVPR